MLGRQANGKKGKNMNGVILETSKKKSIVLTRDGRIESIPSKRNHREGMELELENRKKNALSWNRIASIAAVFVVLLLTGGSVYAWFTPYQHINIDINPSVKLTGNRFNRIIGVKGLNSDGEHLIKNMKLINLPLQKGLDGVIKEAENQGFLTDESSTVTVSVEAPSEVLAEKTMSQLKQHVQDKNPEQNKLQVRNSWTEEPAKDNGHQKKAGFTIIKGAKNSGSNNKPSGNAPGQQKKDQDPEKNKKQNAGSIKQNSKHNNRKTNNNSLSNDKNRKH